MKLKGQILTFLVVITIIGTPIVQSKQLSYVIENEIIEVDHINKNDLNNDDIKILIHYIDVDGKFQKFIKHISKVKYQQFIDEISDISNQTYDIIDFFQVKLQLMKKYEIIPNEVSIQNIVDFNKVGNLGSKTLNVTEADSFISHFAPIFMVGMGFGIGLGFRRMPVLQRIAGNLFSMGLIGLGAVVCFDIVDWSIYYQFTFTFPYLMHILSGFIGIMLFAFDNILPPKNGPPFTLYSNFLAIGMAGLAIGFKFPPTF